MRYYEGETSPVAVNPTKYDGFVFRMTGAKYRCQPKSGRAIVLQALVQDGMTMAELCRLAATQGVEIEGKGRRYFNSGFVCGSALKHLVSPTRIFSLEHPEGLTLEEVSRTRTRGPADPEVVAKRAAKRQDVEARKAARAEAKAAKAQAKAAAKEQRANDLAERKAAKLAERTQKKAEREAARLVRLEEKRAKDEAKAAAAVAQETGSQADAPATTRKGKRGRKASGGAAPEAAAA